MRRQQSKRTARLDSCEKLKQDVCDVARATSARGRAPTSSLMEVDAFRRANGKVKIKDNGKKKDSHDGHIKSECGKLAADKTKSTSERKPRNNNELRLRFSTNRHTAHQRRASQTGSIKKSFTSHPRRVCTDDTPPSTQLVRPLRQSLQ